MALPQIIDWLLHGGNTAVLLIAVWKMTREEEIKKNFPPHRHVNGSKILYPDGYEPTKVEQINIV